MASYVWCNSANRFVDKKTREPMPLPERDEVCAPQIMKDIEPHMFGKHYIGSRSTQRELAKTEGYVPFERVSKWARRMPKKDFNERDDNWQQFITDVKSEVATKAGINDPKQYELEMKARKAVGSLREKVKKKEELKKSLTE